MASDSTIYALSSGAGRAGIAVMRISGPRAGAVLERLCGGVPVARSATYRNIETENGELLDRGIVLWFPGPASFTGEDSCELHVHGSRAVIDGLVRTLGVLPGLRAADAGEFARRAFVNGKLDLTEVEGLADLIDAETDAQRVSALRQAGGDLRHVLSGFRERVLALRGLAEAAIDFVDEGDVPDELAVQIESDAKGLCADLLGMLRTAERGTRLRDGLCVVLTGAPNVGKSSLLNALAGHEVAIVDEEAGTTRDPVEVKLDLGGVPVRVIDTAGIRQGAGRVERRGIDRAREIMLRADLCLRLVDSDVGRTALTVDSDENSGESCGESQVWWVRTKIDRNGVGRGMAADWRHEISVVTDVGVDELVTDLSDFANDRAGALEDVAITRARHETGLKECHEAVLRALAFSGGEQMELCAEELRVAGDAIGRLTGAVSTEDVLGVIFSSFCVGK